MFLRENQFRWNKERETETETETERDTERDRERQREIEREFGLVFILSELGLWTKDYMKSHTVAIRL